MTLLNVNLTSNISLRFVFFCRSTLFIKHVRMLNCWIFKHPPLVQRFYSNNSFLDIAMIIFLVIYIILFIDWLCEFTKHLYKIFVFIWIVFVLKRVRVYLKDLSYFFMGCWVVIDKWNLFWYICLYLNYGSFFSV